MEQVSKRVGTLLQEKVQLVQKVQNLEFVFSNHFPSFDHVCSLFVCKLLDDHHA